MTKTLAAVASITSILTLASCGGGGSSTSAPNSNNLQPDPCTVNSQNFGDVAIPPAYAGHFTIPVPSQRLAAPIVRTMDFKDLDAWWSKPLANGCTDREKYIVNVYTETLNRMQALGVQRVWVYNYGPWDDFSKPVWSIAKTDYAIPDNALRAIASAAKARGIQVVLTWQMNNSDKVGPWNSLDTGDNMTRETLVKILNSFEAHIVGQARFAQEVGLSGIAADLGSFNPKGVRDDPQFRELYVASVQRVITTIRQNFSGQVFYGQYDSVLDERIMAGIDGLVYVTWLGGTRSSTPMSVSALRQSFSDSINWFKQRYDQALSGKYATLPIYWTIYGQSTRDFYLSDGYLEDSFCFSPCPQRSIATDFSAQAVAIEAALQAVAAQPHFTTASVSVTNYWLTDDIEPTDVSGNTAFPNLSSSIRNKPAEGLVRYWFGR